MGYTITDVGLDEIKGEYHINVTTNPAYWQFYEEVLRQVQEDPSDKTLMEVIEYDDKDLKLPRGNGDDNYKFLTSRFPYSITYGLFSGSELIKDKENIRLYISYEYFISEKLFKVLNLMTTPENYLSGRFYNINRHLCEFTEKPFYCKIASKPNPKPDDPFSWEGKLVLF
ncbi:MAG: hypothetical protein HY096_08710 [Nitrospinae bacterium]|nr:hypothetical protein [Nitrospinota bacterium]